MEINHIENLVKLLIDDNQKELEKIYANIHLENYDVLDIIYEKIKNASNSSIDNFIGFTYATKGVYCKAKQHYKLSANIGNSCAQYNLGHMYLRGKYVLKNYEKALNYFALSASQGNSVAQYSIGDMYIEGLGVDINYEIAFYYYDLAAEQNNFRAQNNIGFLYRQGKGCTMNREIAAQYYYMSYKNGSKIAKKNLESMLKNSETYEYIISIMDDVHIYEIEIKKLEKKNIKLKYKPGGVGYIDAKADFDFRKNL
jgi:TPR repeat protein